MSCYVFKPQKIQKCGIVFLMKTKNNLIKAPAKTKNESYQPKTPI
jgi:hypothetical protein